MSSSYRYPLNNPKVYMQKTGRLLAHRVGQIIQTFGFKTWICKGQSNGVDLKVWNNNMLILVAELLNWSPKTELDLIKRKPGIINNLSDPIYKNCKKVLIYTTMKNPYAINNLYIYNIDTLKLDNQILPKLFHEHFAAKKQITCRKIDSKRTTLHIKIKLLNYFISKKLLPQ